MVREAYARWPGCLSTMGPLLRPPSKTWDVISSAITTSPPACHSREGRNWSLHQMHPKEPVTQRFRAQAWQSDSNGFENWLQHFPAGWPWASLLSFLSHSCLICKKEGIVTVQWQALCIPSFSLCQRNVNFAQVSLPMISGEVDPVPDPGMNMWSALVNQMKGNISVRDSGEGFPSLIREGDKDYHFALFIPASFLMWSWWVRRTSLMVTPFASYGGNLINTVVLAAVFLPRGREVETPNQCPVFMGHLKQSHRLHMFHVRKKPLFVNATVS